MINPLCHCLSPYVHILRTGKHRIRRCRRLISPRINTDVPSVEERCHAPRLFDQAHFMPFVRSQKTAHLMPFFHCSARHRCCSGSKAVALCNNVCLWLLISLAAQFRYSGQELFVTADMVPNCQPDILMLIFRKFIMIIAINDNYFNCRILQRFLCRATLGKRLGGHQGVRISARIG